MEHSLEQGIRRGIPVSGVGVRACVCGRGVHVRVGCVSVLRCLSHTQTLPQYTNESIWYKSLGLLTGCALLAHSPGVS